MVLTRAFTKALRDLRHNVSNFFTTSRNVNSQNPHSPQNEKNPQQNMQPSHNIQNLQSYQNQLHTMNETFVTTEAVVSDTADTVETNADTGASAETVSTMADPRASNFPPAMPQSNLTFADFKFITPSASNTQSLTNQNYALDNMFGNSTDQVSAREVSDGRDYSILKSRQTGVSKSLVRSFQTNLNIAYKKAVSRMEWIGNQSINNPYVSPATSDGMSSSGSSDAGGPQRQYLNWFKSKFTSGQIFGPAPNNSNNNPGAIPKRTTDSPLVTSPTITTSVAQPKVPPVSESVANHAVNSGLTGRNAQSHPTVPTSLAGVATTQSGPVVTQSGPVATQSGTVVTQ